MSRPNAASQKSLVAQALVLFSYESLELGVVD